MIILGLTGSIGMGKTYTSQLFKNLGAEIFNADNVVHELLSPSGKAYDEVSKKFPAAISKGKIDREKLGDIVFSNNGKLKILEKILHPLVWEEEEEFTKLCLGKHKKVIILDIPLLFETRADERCDYTAVVAASSIVQQNRLSGRGGKVTAEKLGKISLQQMPTAEKIKRADFVIRTGLDKRHVLKQVTAIMNFFKKGKYI